MKWLTILLALTSSCIAANNGLPNELPRQLVNRAPFRVDIWEEVRRPWQDWQPNYYSLRRIGALSQDTVFFIKIALMSSDSIYFCRVPSPSDSQHVMLTTAQGRQLLFTSSHKPTAPSVDDAMRLEIALGLLSDSLNLLEKKHADYIKIGNKGMWLIGFGTLLTGLCVGDLTDKYPNTSFQKTSLRAGIAAGSMMTAYGLFEVFRYLTRRHDFKSMETRLGSYTEDDIRRLMNTERQ